IGIPIIFLVPGLVASSVRLQLLFIHVFSPPIYYYNNKRIKEKLNWRSPVDYRIEYKFKIA
ncbi:MAG: hypothetical protein RR139_12560, partial [Lachnospiraceae bacterium]